MHVQIDIQYIKICINTNCTSVLLDCWVEEDDNMAMLEDDDNMAVIFHSYPGSTSITAQILDQ